MYNEFKVLSKSQLKLVDFTNSQITKKYHSWSLYQWILIFIRKLKKEGDEHYLKSLYPYMFASPPHNFSLCEFFPGVCSKHIRTNDGMVKVILTAKKQTNVHPNLKVKLITYR